MSNRKNTKKEILEKIKKNEIKMKPWWWFEAFEDTKKTAVVVFVLAISLMMGGMIYWWVLNNPGQLLQFGTLGWEIIIETFPYALLGGSILLTIVTIITMGKIGNNYKKPLEKLALIMAGIIAATTLLVWLVIKSVELEILLRLV